jgi:hypothetical protein
MCNKQAAPVQWLAPARRTRATAARQRLPHAGRQAEPAHILSTGLHHQDLNNAEITLTAPPKRPPDTTAGP